MTIRLKATIRSLVQLSILLVWIQSSAAQEIDPTTAARPVETHATFKLVKTKDVAPEYPRRALQRGREGWVDLAVTISPDGTVESVAIIDAKPKRLFERAAIRAVSKWQFEPPRDSGINTPIIRNYRISFVLDH